MNSEILTEFWKLHNGKIVGTLVGLLFGVFIILFGFFYTIFVMVCMVSGYVIGKRIDEKENIMDILDRILPPGYYR